MPITVGSPAPDFTLYDTQKKPVRLSDHLGNNILLLFFPFAFSSVCTAELCAVRDNLNRYEHLSATVFGISVDSLYTLAKFKEEQNLNFSLLSDFNKEVSQLYGALYDTFNYGMKGVSKRAAFVIDKHGTVQYAEVLENAAQQPDFTAIEKVLRKITDKV